MPARAKPACTTRCQPWRKKGSGRSRDCLSVSESCWNRFSAIATERRSPTRMSPRWQLGMRKVPCAGGDSLRRRPNCAPGFYWRAAVGGPGRHADRGRQLEEGSQDHRAVGASGSRRGPLGAGGLFRVGPSLASESRNGVQAESREIQVPEMGPASLSRLSVSSRLASASSIRSISSTLPRASSARTHQRAPSIIRTLLSAPTRTRP